MIRFKKVFPICLAVAVIASAISSAQTPFRVPEPSPKAVVTQTIGISEVTVTYHRPGVKGREVWGKLVPYGEVWRAGANENTTISFSHQVTVGGKILPAGTYGLHMIPTKESWTVIFNRNSTSWGSFFYKEAEDALRITVKPQATEQTEWLQYTFSDLSESGAVLSLSWEKVRVPIAFSFDTPAIVIAYARDEYLRGAAGFTWDGFNRAAQYCVRKNVDLPLALEWADRSISITENFTNLRTKAAVLDKMGKSADASVLREKSMTLATEAEINTLGYGYMNEGKTKEALVLFEKNVKDHPDSWNTYDSLGEGLAAAGDTKGAIKNYEKALKMGVSEANRKRIADILQKLKAK
jgi:tetratricopeptide (TPR) repeat protein